MDDKGFLDYAEGDEKIESARLNRDAQEYYRLCNFYGKKTRDEELYEEGSGGSVDVDRLKIVAYERKVAGEKRPSSLEKLAKSLGNRLQSGEEIKGEISYKVGSDVQG
ncbi:MAG TPA: hypothetical protein ENH46_07180, partial [Candidatus Pacearchaeota archaeon]|nr:hypothetical protein [Candidatus Pacearchaeota archaeon]